MTEQQSWHTANAERQRKDVEDRVIETIKRLRSDITATYNADIKRHSYPHNRGKLSKAEFLRQAGLDKNTLKKEYHGPSRTKVDQFLTWALSTCGSTAPSEKADQSRQAAPPPKLPTALELAQQQRDDAAEKFAIGEIALSEALRENEELHRKINGKDARIQQLVDEIVRLKTIVVGLEPANRGNVVDHPNFRK